MIAALLTQEQAQLLIGVEFKKDSIFNPIQDSNGQWFISLEEVNECSIDWVKNLTTGEIYFSWMIEGGE